MDTVRDGLISTTAPTNSAPITIATNSAETVHSVIAQCTQTARTDSTLSSRACLGKSGFCASLSALYLSTSRPNLPVSTLKIAPTPVNKNTGATANWMTCETVVKFSATICMFILVSNCKIVAAWLENIKPNNLKAENQK